MEEYLRSQVKPAPLYKVLFDNRFFQYFAAATPGMRELVTIGKIWELAQLQRRSATAAELVRTPSTSTVPAVGVSIAARSRRSVVLPAPFGPRTARRSPDARSRAGMRSTSRPPLRWRTSRRVRAAPTSCCAAGPTSTGR